MGAEETISALLQAKYEESAMSDSALGAMCGGSQTTYNRWRHGEAVPETWRIPDLARLLAIPEPRVAAAIDAQRRENGGRDGRRPERSDTSRRLARLESKMAQMEAQHVALMRQLRQAQKKTEADTARELRRLRRKTE